jgi:hypothetical protein
MASRNMPRKILTPISPRRIRRNYQNNVYSRVPIAINKTTETAGQCRSLSSTQLHLATYLAFACPHSQRNHAGLLAEMERKRKLQQDREAQQTKEKQTRKPAETQDSNSYPALSTMGPEPIQFLQKHPACGPDWRIRAEARLKRAEISLDKEWSSKTWSNKTNIPERLFLLEADGFDITSLQRSSVSSSQVTEVIMSRIEERKEQHKILKASKLQIPRADTHFASAIQPPAESVTSHTPPVQRRSELIFDSLGYHPEASVDQKRKRSDGSALVDDPEAVAISCSIKESGARSLKKVRVRTPKEVESDIRAQSWVLFKKTVAREIFSHSKSRCNAPCKIPFASITIRFPSCRGEDRCSCDTSESSLRISSRGYEYIMNELKYLADRHQERAECDYFDIADPDFEEKHTSTNRLIENTNIAAGDDRHPKVISGRQRRIRVHTTDTQCVITGDTQSLEGLLRRLRGNDLLHTTKWMFNGLTIVPCSNITWSLSNKTLFLLDEIRRQLQGGGRDDARKIDVDWVYVGEMGHV